MEKNNVTASWMHLFRKVPSNNFSILTTNIGEKKNKHLLKVFSLLKVHSHSASVTASNVILIDDVIDALHGNQCMDLLGMYCAVPPLTVADPGFWSKTTWKKYYTWGPEGVAPAPPCSGGSKISPKLGPKSKDRCEKLLFCHFFLKTARNWTNLDSREGASVPDDPFLDPLMPWTHHWLRRDCWFFFIYFFFCILCAASILSFVAMANMTSSHSSSKMVHTVNDVKN